jgi:hypothetical protein
MMATVTLTNAGVGGTQSGTITTAAGSAAGIIMVTNHSDAAITFDVATAGTVVQSGLSLQAKSYMLVTGLNDGAQTLVNLSTAHGTSAQNAEIIYNTLVA